MMAKSFAIPAIIVMLTMEYLAGGMYRRSIISEYSKAIESSSDVPLVIAAYIVLLVVDAMTGWV